MSPQTAPAKCKSQQIQIVNGLLAPKFNHIKRRTIRTYIHNNNKYRIRLTCRNTMVNRSLSHNTEKVKMNTQGHQSSLTAQHSFANYVIKWRMYYVAWAVFLYTFAWAMHTAAFGSFADGLTISGRTCNMLNWL